jgi:dienelactone hydrolase
MTEDLKKIDVPTLILHGDDDQIVPLADSAMLSAKIVKQATLKVYKGAPHGMCTTHKQQVNEDLLAFFEEKPSAQEAPMNRPPNSLDAQLRLHFQRVHISSFSK